MVNYKIIRDNSTCYSYMPIGLVVELDGDSVHVLVHTLVLELEGLSISLGYTIIKYYPAVLQVVPGPLKVHKIAPPR